MEANFTTKMLNQIEIPSKGVTTVHDTKTPHLILCVRPSGLKTFYRYGRVNGKPKRIKIGNATVLTIAQARGECQKLNGDIARGEYGQDKPKTIETLQDLFDLYYKKHAVPHTKQPREILIRYNSWLKGTH